MTGQAAPMTEGSIGKRITLFAMPIFLGNLFQQLYNTADSLIVGNFLGSNALAAVSSSGSLIFMLIGFLSGMSIGAGVVIARYFGAGDRENMDLAIHTTVAFGLAASVVMTLIGVLLSPQILRLMATPEVVMGDSVTYLRIYFAGSVGFVMYNIFVGILQAVGDSRHPLYYLIVSSLVNIVLDITFIAGFGMGVEGAAIATVISQLVSALLCLIQLTCRQKNCRLYLRRIAFTPRLLKQIIRMGLPSGLQNSIIAFANVVVQSNINSFGELAMAGVGAYSKIEGFGFLPITSFTMALTTFIGQNLGAAQYERAKKGARFGIWATVVLAELIGVAVFVFAPWLIAAFDSNPEVISIGVAKARTSTLFFFLLAFSHAISAVLRGAGRAIVPMTVMLVFWCVVRVGFLTITVPLTHSILMLYWVYPLTWALSSLTFLIYYKKADWLHSRF
ncbi:MATE family efflux transporter [Flavonifractor sp. An92]|uniref:MATE family efflux transporter n=1 Tax=Flavonifractor sp. An92 TaxID=1965666 RepID=UPI000B39004C|nr:MATE family efflux transporter [Flavonifractor sp. An92]OUN08120.1 MATE family efflux transporter [Flavonifractor sp. An92]